MNMSAPRALSMDGGGIRGVVTATWLERLEEQLGGPAAGHFDVVAGTSAGSLSALGVASGISGAELRTLFEERGRDIFPGFFVRTWDRFVRIPVHGLSAPKYSGERIEKVLKDCFGERRLGDALVRTLIPVYSMTEARALVLDSDDPLHADIPMWQAARASTAAPSYFPGTQIMAEGKFHVVMDGGIAINNPAIAASSLLRQESGCDWEDVTVVSLGTGEPPTIAGLQEVQEYGLLQWGTKLLKIMLEGPNDHVDYVCRRLHGDRYHRVQVKVSFERYAIDDASAENISYLVKAARTEFDQVDRVAQALARL